MKNKLLLTSVLLLIIFTLGGCGKGKVKYDPDNFIQTGDKIVKEKITLKFFAPLHPLHNSDGYNAMRLFKEMEEITNIHIEWVYGPIQTYNEKRALSWQEKENIDGYFLWNMVDEQVKYGEAGILRPLNDLIDDYAPNYKAILDANPDLKKLAILPDGNMYSTVIINDVPRDQTFKQYINIKWLNNLGLKMPSTTDEYFEVLKAFKTQDPNQNGLPDEIPLSSAKLYQTRNFLMSAFGMVSTGMELVDEEVVFVPTTDNYRSYLEYAHRLYENELLDNNTFIMSESDLAAKGSVVGSFDNAAAYLVAGVENDADYVALPALTSSINSEQMWLGFETNLPTGFVIPTSTPYYREIVRWIDFLYSEEGIKLQAFGKEGVDWNWDDENLTSWTFNTPEGINPEQYRGTLTPAVGLGPIAYWDADFVLKENNELTRRINLNVENAGYMDYIKIPFPPVIFNKEESSKLAIIKTDSDIYMQVFEEKVITGAIELNDKTWNEHLDNLKALKIYEMIEIYENAYSRYHG